MVLINGYHFLTNKVVFILKILPQHIVNFKSIDNFKKNFDCQDSEMSIGSQFSFTTTTTKIFYKTKSIQTSPSKRPFTMLRKKLSYQASVRYGISSTAQKDIHFFFNKFIFCIRDYSPKKIKILISHSPTLFFILKTYQQTIFLTIRENSAFILFILCIGTIIIVDVLLYYKGVARPRGCFVF
ncbi:hypothetical protein BpHYR1_023435 [Brachionus plicatilis]|uniref:Transmembrane protein n=1 Tax=Brachionus plicatilis TaxID=10195 RepID=A0A3M7Q6U0_BRAPC|nr:hypothetical protein BpHYR1_023435 [Brachionus plicatilis]